MRLGLWMGLCLTACSDGAFVHTGTLDDDDTDTTWDVGTELGTDADTEVDPDTDTEPDVDTEADTEPDVDTEADTEPDADTEADTEPDVDTEADTEPDVDTEADTEPAPGWNTAINPSCDEGHAHILRLYPAFFGRDPDVSGAEYWFSQYTDEGLSLQAIEVAFGASAEFQQLYGGVSNHDFLVAVYDNLFNRAPDSEGLAYWTGVLDREEHTRVEVLGFISASTEFTNRVPYEPSAFCTFIDDHAAGYSQTQIAPDTVWVRSADGNVNVVYVDKTGDAELRVSPGANLRIPGFYGGTAAINGNWFNFGSDYFAGYSISDGVVRGTMGSDHRRGYLGDDTSGILRIGHYADHGGGPPPNAWNMVSGQTLVVGGQPWPDTTTATGDPTFSNTHPRTAAGVTAEGYLILAVVDGRSYGPGMTGTQTANLLIALGAQRGIMLDGGGSSAMYVEDRGIVNQPSDGSPRSVRNQLIVDAPLSWFD